MNSQPWSPFPFLKHLALSTFYSIDEFERLTAGEEISRAKSRIIFVHHALSPSVLLASDGKYMILVKPTRKAQMDSSKLNDGQPVHRLHGAVKISDFHMAIDTYRTRFILVVDRIEYQGMEDVVNITEPPGLESDKDVQTLLAYLQRSSVDGCIPNPLLSLRRPFDMNLSQIFVSYGQRNILNFVAGFPKVRFLRCGLNMVPGSVCESVNDVNDAILSPSIVDDASTDFCAESPPQSSELDSREELTLLSSLHDEGPPKQKSPSTDTENDNEVEEFLGLPLATQAPCSPRHSSMEERNDVSARSSMSPGASLSLDLQLLSSRPRQRLLVPVISDDLRPLSPSGISPGSRTSLNHSSEASNLRSNLRNSTIEYDLHSSSSSSSSSSSPSSPSSPSRNDIGDLLSGNVNSHQELTLLSSELLINSSHHESEQHRSDSENPISSEMSMNTIDSTGEDHTISNSSSVSEQQSSKDSFDAMERSSNLFDSEIGSSEPVNLLPKENSTRLGSENPSPSTATSSSSASSSSSLPESQSHLVRQRANYLESLALSDLDTPEPNRNDSLEKQENRKLEILDGKTRNLFTELAVSSNPALMTRSSSSSDHPLLSSQDGNDSFLPSNLQNTNSPIPSPIEAKSAISSDLPSVNILGKAAGTVSSSQSSFVSSTCSTRSKRTPVKSRRLLDSIESKAFRRSKDPMSKRQDTISSSQNMPSEKQRKKNAVRLPTTSLSVEEPSNRDLEISHSPSNVHASSVVDITPQNPVSVTDQNAIKMNDSPLPLDTSPPILPRQPRSPVTTIDSLLSPSADIITQNQASSRENSQENSATFSRSFEWYESYSRMVDEMDPMDLQRVLFRSEVFSPRFSPSYHSPDAISPLRKRPKYS